MMATALIGMYVGSYVLCCLGSGVFRVGAAMNTLQKSPTKLISEALLSHPEKLWLSHSRSRRARHIEVLEVRGLFKKVVKYQQKKPDEDMVMALDNRKKKPVSLDKGKKLHYIGQTIVAGEGKNTVIITNRKHKSTNKKNIRKGPLMKRNKKKFGERHLGKSKKSKRPDKRLKNPKYRKQKVTMERDNNEMYSEAKRTAPMSRRIEFFRRARRNNKKVKKRKVSDRRNNSFNNSLEKMGLLISVSPNVERYQELLYGADGETVSEEATTIKNDLRGLPINADTNTDRWSKEHIDTFSTVVTTTISGLEGSELWTHATTTRTEILSQQEDTTSKELHISNNETKSSEPSINTTTVLPVTSLTRSPYEVMTDEVTIYVNGNRGDNISMDTTTRRKSTPSWNNPETRPTMMSANSWIKIPLNVPPEVFGGSIVEDQLQMLPPNNSVTQVESSGDSEVHVHRVQNETLHVTETTHVSSTNHAFPYPTGQDDGNITNTVIDDNREMQDSVYSPLEMVLKHGSESKYCKPGYKYHAGACKSMCDMGEFFCEIGGQCVIVENLGPMCRCHQTNTLCYKGECCRLSLTPLQLICVIGSCCIFVSVFLGSISLLIRRMDIKAVSKSVRTRLWISTLMPGSRSSSFSHLAESDRTSCTEYDSPDFSSFNHRKKMIYDGATLTSERTQL